MTNRHSPFPKAHGEVALPRAPLVAVLAQARFEPILSIQNQASLAPFQDAIRGEYPILRADRNTTTTIDPSRGALTTNRQMTWRFSDMEEKWQVSLSSTNISLRTSEYRSRTEFLGKFGQLLAALTTHFNPGVVTRTGVRYVNRLTGDALGDLKSLVKPPLLGVVSSDLEKVLYAATSEAIFEAKPYRTLVRWGCIPPNSTTDPSVIKPDDKTSWILDIDSSHTGKRAWNQQEVSDEFTHLASTSYDFFRWAVEDKFLTHFGGKL